MFSNDFIIKKYSEGKVKIKWKDTSTIDQDGFTNMDEFKIKLNSKMIEKCYQKYDKFFGIFVRCFSSVDLYAAVQSWKTLSKTYNFGKMEVKVVLKTCDN